MPVCIVAQCGGECDEQGVLHKGMITTQLGKATCVNHVGGDREPVPFTCIEAKRRLSYIRDEKLQEALLNGKCKSRWPSDPAFGWKYPPSSASSYFRDDADQGFLLVEYDEASEDEDDKRKLLVLWKGSSAPLASSKDAIEPVWGEHGVQMTVNAAGSRLTCAGPTHPHGVVPLRSRKPPFRLGM
jgi:hypothetical protein